MTKTRDLADLGGGFIQAGTGAVQRTVESKLQDTVSVKDFGAVGDGVADDTAAIQAAINWAVTSGARVWIPKTSTFYRVTANISVTLADGKKLVIESDGAELRRTNAVGGSILGVYSASAESAPLGTNTELIVRGLNFDGRGVPEQWAETNIAQLIVLRGIATSVEYLTVENCKFNKIYGYGINSGGAYISSVVNCSFLEVGGHWYLNDAYDAFGDGVYHRSVKENGNILISHCNIVGYSSAYSRIGVTLEYSTGKTYSATVEHCLIQKYDRAIHVEESSNVNLTIHNCRLIDFRVGIFIYGDQSGGRLTCSESYFKYGSGDYSGSQGWTVNIYGYIPMDFHNCVFTVGTTAFSANAGPDIRYYGCKFDYNGRAIILANSTAVYRDCRFLNITASTAYYFYDGSHRFVGCEFNGTGNLSFSPNSGTFTEVTNCVSYGPVLTVPMDKCSIDYIGFTLANLGVSLPAGVRQFNSTTRYIANFFNTFPNHNGLCGIGSGSTSGGGSFTASSTTIASPVWVNHSKATLIVKFSDGAPLYVFRPETFWDPSAYGRGYYIQNIKRDTAGNWVADGAVVTKGNPTAAAFNGTTVNGLTWTAVGGFASICQAIIIPRYLETYIL